jgi:hypothetical protein
VEAIESPLDPDWLKSSFANTNFSSSTKVRKTKSKAIADPALALFAVLAIRLDYCFE